MRNLLLIILSKVLGVEKKTIDFVLYDGKQINQMLAIIVPSVVIGAGLYQVSPLAIKYILDIIVNPEISKNWFFIGGNNILLTILYLLIFAVLMQIIDYSTSYFNNVFSYKLSQNAQVKMEDQYFKKLASFDLSFLSSDNNTRILYIVGDVLVNIQEQIRSFLMTIIRIPVMIVSLIFILPLLHPLFFVLVLVTSGINFLLEHIKTSKYRNWEFIVQRSRSERRMYREKLFFSFGRFYFNGLFSQINKKYIKVRKTVLDIEYKKDTGNFFWGFIQGITSSITAYAVLFVGAMLVVSKIITVGSFALLDSYLSRINSMFADISNLFSTILTLNLNLIRLEFVLNLKPKFVDLLPISNPPERYNIEFKNVSFTYPAFYDDEKEYFNKLAQKMNLLIKDEVSEKGFFKRIFWKLLKRNNRGGRNSMIEKELKQIMSIFENKSEGKTILKDINLKLEKGKSYALVGKNGAGKSTLVNLLKRGFDATEGQIIIDDTDIRQIDKDLLKDNIVSIEQNTLRFDGILTVKEQLLLNSLARENLEEEISELLKVFELNNLISNLDLVLGEGLALSGGQQQLLELIRVLLSKRKLIILDEATNQLDAEKEMIFINLIKKYLPESIVVFVTHRMSTCLKCDYIISLKDGVIEDVDSPAKMLEKENEFSRFWKLQN